MGAPQVVRVDNQYRLQGLFASMSFHFSFASPVTRANVLDCQAYGRLFDTGPVDGWDGWSQYRTLLSFLTASRARSLDPLLNFEYGDEQSDATVIGNDGSDLVLDPVASIVVQWVTSYAGKGRQGRSYLPYAGGGQIATTVTSEIAPFAFNGIQNLVRAYVAGATSHTGGKLCVLSRLANGVVRTPPVPVDVVAAKLNRGTFGHVHSRQQL